MSFKSAIRSFVYRKQSKEYYWNLRQKARNCRFPLLRWYYAHQHEKLMEKHNANIPYTTEIAGPPVLPHGLSGIYISAGAKVGSNCVIFHQVSIGSNTLPDSKRQGFPTVGDNVYIGTGAKIIGNVRIGNNVRIGANCVVTEDIPDNATVVMERPRILVRETPPDNRFLSQSQLRTKP